MPAGTHRVFDSWPLIALLEDEPAAREVRKLIGEATASRASMWITVVNLGEVWYSTVRTHSIPVADAKMEEIRSLGFELVDIDWTLTLQAARFKAEKPLSYADCFAAALAKQHDAELVTGDPEFKRLENEIKIHWL